MTSRTVCVWIPTIKTRSQLLSEMLVGPGGLSARTPRTVHEGHADRPMVGRGPSARSTRAAHRSVWNEVNFGPFTEDPRTVRPKKIFLEKLCQKPQIFNKSQEPVDRSLQESRLSAPQQKTDFSQDFQRNLFIFWKRHSSKCNACKFLIKVALWKVKPMKLIPLDSTSIYTINQVIYHPITTLWLPKMKSLALTFSLSSFAWHDIQAILLHTSWAHHFIGLTYSYISIKILVHNDYH
jgi:hypothetical protein